MIREGSNFFRRNRSSPRPLTEDEISYACRHGNLDQLLSMPGKIEADKFIKEAASAGQIEVLDYLITQGARDFSPAIESAVQVGQCEAASFLLLCSHCSKLDSNAVHNFVYRGGETQQSIDVDGAGVSEFVFLPKFNLSVLISLVEEGRGVSGTDGDVDDCLWFLLVSKQFTHQMSWQSLGLSYIASRWKFGLLADTVTDLDISQNKIGPTLPECMSQLVNLKHLNCRDNELSDLPAFLFEMQLHSLNYSFNLIERIPHCCPQTIRTLNLASNKLTFLPGLLAQTHIQTFKLADNPFTTFPSVLCSMSSLQQLELEGCKFVEVPNELSRLEDLKYLTLPKLPRLTSVTRELPNPEPLLHHLKEKLYVLKPLYEMKLVVIGREGCGKTTLIRRLNKDYTSKRNLPTVGVQVTKLKLPLRDNTIRLPGQSSRTVTFHTWDLSGQQECTALHQCFITPASLYLLVFSLAQESVKELRGWLGNISVRAPGSCVIIVGTQKDKLGSAEAVDAKLMKVLELVQNWGFGNNVSETVAVKLITSVGSEPEHFKSVENLAAELVKQAELMECKLEGNKKMKILGRLIPTSYFELFREIKVLKAGYDSLHKVPVLTEEELWSVVRGNPLFEDIETDAQLAGAVEIMNNLGLIIHFKEPSLQMQYFLDPCWLCNMMEIVVRIKDRDPRLAGTGGILEQGTVRHVLRGNTRFPDELFPQYLRILNRFEIALKLDKDRILVPSLLPDVLPLCVPGNQQYFERQIFFSSLPSGLMYRLLVAAIKHILSVAPDLQDFSVTTEESSERSVSVSEISLDEVVAAGAKKKEPEVGLKLERGPLDSSEVLKFLQVWKRGLSFSHPSLHLFILFLGQGHREGFDIVVSNNPMGSKALCHLIDNVSTLLDDWYWPCFSRDESSENRVVQQVPCPSCHRHTFPYEECVAMLGVADHIFCPEEDMEIPLSQLVPDIFLSDLDDSYLTGDLQFSEEGSSLLGKGAFGSVYVGLLAGVKVAVKTFTSVPGYPESGYLDLRREVSILKKMNNPCLVKMLAVKLRPRPCMAIEFAPGGDLADKLKAGVSLPRLLLYKVIHQTACALAYLHGHQVIYRDLKPSNILIFSMDVCTTPNVKLSDYGIAGEGAGAKGFHGTPGYQAPEMLLYLGTEEYTTAVDVYSFAFLIYEAICRVFPYTGQHRVDIKRQVITGQRPQHYRTLPASRMGLWNLKKVMEGCWAQDPDARPTMPAICRTVSHPGFVMLMGYTVLSGTAPSRCYYLPSTERVCVLADTFITVGAALDVAVLPDSLPRYRECLSVVTHQGLLIALVSTGFCRSFLRFETSPELCLFVVEETEATSLAASEDFLFVGGARGSLTKILVDGLVELVVAKKNLGSELEVLDTAVLERTEQTETVQVGFNSLIGSESTRECRVVKLIVLTARQIFVVSSDFRQLLRHEFGTESPGRLLCGALQSKVFATNYGHLTISVFDLVKKKPCSRNLEVSAGCSALATTAQAVWVGTQQGSIYIFSPKRPFNLLSRIRPCVGEISSILSFRPSWSLENLTTTACVFVTGKGKFSDFSQSDSETPQNSRGDLLDGIFAFVFEELPVSLLEQFEGLFQTGGIL